MNEEIFRETVDVAELWWPVKICSHEKWVTGFVFGCWLLRWLSHRSGRQPKTYVKPEVAVTVFKLLMMGGMSPETC
jgi:hypothetical protein